MRVFDFKRRTVMMANSGLPYPVRCSGDTARRSSCRACRSDRSRVRRTTRWHSISRAGDVYVFCTDGVSEARDAAGREFGTTRLLDIVAATTRKSARELVDAIFAAVREFRARRADARRHDGGRA